jgi:hypothetical protein
LKRQEFQGETMSKHRILSTTALANRIGIEKKQLFSLLEEKGLLKKIDGVWTLTSAGEAVGGGYIESKDFGRYVGWPEDFDPVSISAPTSSTITPTSASPSPILTATALGNHFGISANKCNYILSELGWVKKGLRGWLVTEPGLRIGGKQAEDHRSGVPYVRWPDSLLTNRTLLETMDEVKGTRSEATAEAEKAPKADGFREKFPANHRAADGHMVRSRAEMLIDNWLYMAEIVHAYERKLPIEEDVYCDFYIPTGKVYIEFWGLENEPKYQARKAEKKAIYERYGFNLIELGDSDVQNLDDILPKHLLKYGVQAY